MYKFKEGDKIRSTNGNYNNYEFVRWSECDRNGVNREVCKECRGKMVIKENDIEHEYLICWMNRSGIPIIEIDMKLSEEIWDI